MDQPVSINSNTASGAVIVDHARTWVGTPYHHQASKRGVGCDCIGLVRGIWRHLYGSEPERIPGYSRDWGEVDGNERIVDAGNRHLIKIDLADIQPGDIFAMRWKGGRVAKHVGVFTGDDTFIHAYEKAGVVEVPLNVHWMRLMIAAWRFPAHTNYWSR